MIKEVKAQCVPEQRPLDPSWKSSTNPDSISMMASNASELVVESFFPQSYGTFKQRAVSEAVELKIWLMKDKVILFDLIKEIRDEPARLDPAFERGLAQPALNPL